MINSYLGYKVVECSDFNPVPIEFTQDFNNFTTFTGSPKNRQIATDFITADTETSNNYLVELNKGKGYNADNVRCWIYQWALIYCDTIVYGRTISEFIDTIDKIKTVNNIFRKEYTTTINETIKVTQKVFKLLPDSVKKMCYQNNNGELVFNKVDELGNEIVHDKKIVEYRKIIIYIHNLAYDYSYIKQHLVNKYPNAITRMLAIKTRKPISFEIDGLEFRCSYMLSGMSLANWGKTVNIDERFRKIENVIDYKAIHTPTEELPLTDWEYQFNDVISLRECIKNECILHEKTVIRKSLTDIEKLPLTKTGYIRQDYKNELKKHDETYLKRFRKMSSKGTLTTVYHMLREAFAGGLTHGNRFYAGRYLQITDDNTVKLDGFNLDMTATHIEHRDFVSHYPSQMICMPEFPCCQWYDDKSLEGKPLSRAVNKYKKECYCVRFYINGKMTLINNDETLPIAQKSKFYSNDIGGFRHVDVDNGRILSLQGNFTTTMDNITLGIFLSQYKFENEPIIMQCIHCKKGFISEHIKNVTMKYFYEKTTTKEDIKILNKKYKESGDNNILKELLNMEARNAVAKQILNSGFGCNATDPVRLIINEDYEAMEWTAEKNEKPIDDIIYDTLHNGAVRFDIGVYITALARAELVKFYKLIGSKNFIYADTDSIFYLSNPETESKISEINEKLKQDSEIKGAYCEYNGKRVYLNQFDSENEIIKEFKFLHAKCYAYKTKEGEGNCVIAGVKKKLLDGTKSFTELQEVNNLEPSFTFKKFGGTSNKIVEQKPHTAYFDKDFNLTTKENATHSIECASGTIIYETTKQLNMVDIDSCNPFDDVYMIAVKSNISIV